MMAYKAPVVNNSAATAIISSQIVGDPPASYVQLFQDIFKNGGSRERLGPLWLPSLGYTEAH